MKKQLLKSSENQFAMTYYTRCNCDNCLHYCSSSTPWYPKEAQTSEINTMFTSDFNQNN